MITAKTLLLTAVLAAAPFSVSAASAQSEHNNMTNTTMEHRDRATSDRMRSDQRDMRDRTDRTARDSGMRDHRDMRDRQDMRDHRDMRHHGWSRGHHYGWRNCVVRWHHHRRVRVCR